MIDFNRPAFTGLETEYITDEMIQALKDGKRLYFTVNCDEYAVVIKYKKHQLKHQNTN